MAGKSKCYRDAEGRECSRCHTVKPWEAYHRSKFGTYHRDGICRICRRELAALWKEKNDGVKKRRRAWRIDSTGRECADCGAYKPWSEFTRVSKAPTGRNLYCQTCVRHQRYLRDYGISKEAYQDLFSRQEGACAICGEVVPLFVDHDHLTLKIRGVALPEM
jgi:hypothetical protein